MKKEDFILELLNDKGQSKEYDVLAITADVRMVNRMLCILIMI